MAHRRPFRKAKGPVGLDKVGRNMAQTGPFSGAWSAAAMLGGRVRGAPRATEACLPGVAPVLGRVKGDPVVEAVVVEATAVEVEVMVMAATAVEEVMVVAVATAAVAVKA